MKKKGQRKLDSIQWVIDALDNPPIEKRVRENHKTDEIRADENLSWCPCCRKKWYMFEGKLWKSSGIKLWKEVVCPDCGFPAK